MCFLSGSSGFTHLSMCLYYHLEWNNCYNFWISLDLLEKLPLLVVLQNGLSFLGLQSSTQIFELACHVMKERNLWDFLWKCIKLINEFGKNVHLWYCLSILNMLYLINSGLRKLFLLVTWFCTYYTCLTWLCLS